MRQRRRHLGINAPSTDGICALCGRHPHFNAPKCKTAALVLTIRRPPAWRYLFEKDLGADIMAVCSAPMYQPHDETFCADVSPHDEIFGTDAAC